MPLHLRQRRSNAVEALEDALQLSGRNADALVLDTQHDRVCRRMRRAARDTQRVAPEYFTALSSRLDTAVRRSSASPTTAVALASSVADCIAQRLGGR